jgi:hypothetical protein
MYMHVCMCTHICTLTHNKQSQKSAETRLTSGSALFMGNAEGM